MARWHRLGALAFIASLFVSTSVFAQEYFGKNKVNYSQYAWHYIDSEHFTVYFDKGSLELAEFVAKESERSLMYIEKTLKYTLKNRYPIIIYNSHNGFSVSNISSGEQSEFTGGFTEFAQGRVVIPFTGSYGDLRHVIHHELVHAVTIELWTGGGWLGSLVSQTSTLPPLWIAEGIAEYVSRYGWHKEHDNFMRDATITGYVPSIEIMSFSYFAYPGGNSVFYMMEQEYGKDKVAAFISSFRTARTPDKALKASLGFGLKELDEKYQLWLKRQYWNEINLHNTPNEVAKNLTDREEGRTAYNLAAALSPQGDKVAYLTDRNGTFDIYLMSAIDGKDLGRLVEGQKSSDFESMFVLRPGFTWSPDGKYIAFAAKSN
ncbi:MAG: biopolymer transporter Tol, partial [Candidatus Latescibacteria bacterium]|nr:biopolymer transporter Tol [Candidatus Latescibacterota bacterium]